MEKPLLILKASAGSGKTYKLVEEFLKIILKEESNSYYKSVLALTFTNKAAKEMKERIIGALEVLSKETKEPGFDAGFLKGKVAVLGMSPEKIREKSGACLNEIIHNYGNLSVLTIDKFSHKIVRAFARDLELESDFGIELDSKELKKEVIAELVDSYGRDPKLSSILYEYSRSNIEEGAVWNISTSLFDFSSTLDNEKFEEEVEKLKQIPDEEFDEILKNLHTKISKLKNSYRTIIDAFAKYLLSVSDDKNDYYYKNSGLIGNVLKRYNSNEILDTTMMSNSNIAKCYNERNDFSSSVEISHATEQFKSFIDEHDRFMEDEYPLYSTLSGIRSKFYNIRLINTIQKTVDKLKQDKNIKEISDLNKEISKIILSESIPFIYERIGERYKHFLLDEFQDTSVTQWQNLIPLVENGISEGKKSLIVGDAKQSIYRFRNGEVEQFIQLPDLYNPRNSAIIESKRAYFIEAGEVDSLKDNFRSKKEIVEFNNDFFGKFSKFLPERYQEIYQKDFQQNPIKGAGGYVQISAYEDFDQIAKVAKIIETVKECLEDGFQEKDICIILRNKKEGVRVAESLESQDISVISDESLYVKNDLSVQFIMSALKLVAEPETYEYQSIFAEKYLELMGENTTDVIAYQSKTNKISNFDLKTFLKTHNLPEFESFRKYDSLVELIYLLRIQFQLNYEENPYLELFFEQVYKYEIKKSAFLSGFIDWWTQKGEIESITIPDSTNAVKMMTIHKSKGLQFPVVIIPFCEWGFGDIGSKENILWVSNPTGILDTFCVRAKNPDNEPDVVLKNYFQLEKDQMILDETNNLYVAFTRAIDRLYVFSEISNSGQGKKRDLSPNKISTPLFKAIEEEEFVEFGERRKVNTSKQASINEVSLRTDLSVNKNVHFSFKPIFPNESIQYNIDYGIHLHNVLSGIKVKADLENLDQYLADITVSEEEKNQIKKDIQNLCANKEIADLLFKDITEIISERDIISETGKIIRPDRVLLKENKVLVIDFKTGKPRSKDKKQLAEYEAVLRQMGNESVEGYLVYTKEVEIQKV